MPLAHAVVRDCMTDPTHWQDPQRRMRANHTPDIAHAHRGIFQVPTGAPPRLDVDSLRQLRLPGPDPDSITVARLHQAVHTATRIGPWRTWCEQDHLSLQDIADREGTSLATVRLALLKYGVVLRPAVSQPGRPRRR
ncbi:hypothetical protein ACWFRM_22215 [Streptomyces sp. NPDC055144]